ncbi:MAG: ATP-binding cassette domain-containing protein [Candidatus Marinimicrobia bacterium]|nr:ATP-binding cassette domain-containing protein [Candidatus Neomarinimicrobiota bacterium]
MNSNLININNLSVNYGKTTVLEDINISIPRGEITVILGGSGCGKTTLLKSMLKLQPLAAGSIKIFNRNIKSSEFNQELKKIGMVFQNGALLNSITVRNNISIPLKHHTNLPDEIIDRIIISKLKLVNLEGAGHLLPAELSGGMKKRAAVARAIALDPVLLFCDEPSAGLDPITSASLDNLLIKLKQQLDMTMVIVTHELASVRRIADNIIFLHEGKILFQGSYNEIQNSDNRHIQEFFSSN